ncbi:MAG: Flp pilus assembly protein CpaB [Clostridia bacterium]|nr:Flp pilus assembly protein CpaB [Clostridia bacterium]
MESVNKKVILIAIMMAVLTAFLVFVYIQKATTSPETESYTEVFVAAKTLPAKHLITENDIKQDKVLSKLLNLKAVQNKADIVGKRVKDSIIEGEQILSDRLVDENKMILSYMLPEGKRALSINVNEQIEVANLLRPGDAVDVLVSFDREEVDDGTTKTVFPRTSKTLLQNIEVLALGQEQEVEDTKDKELPKTVTLAVSPEDAEKLTFASEYGVLRLALRPADDKKTIDSKGITRADISNKGVYTAPSSEGQNSANTGQPKQ